MILKASLFSLTKNIISFWVGGINRIMLQMFCFDGILPSNVIKKKAIGQRFCYNGPKILL